MGILQNENAIPVTGGGGFYDHTIEQSCRFDGSTSFLSKTFSSAGNRRTGSVSVWIKRSLLGEQQQIFGGHISNGDQDQILMFNSSSSSSVEDSMSQWWDGATYGDIGTTQVFRDTSGWNHFLLAWDTTQSTDSNRTRLYLNGTEITSFISYNGGTVQYPTQNREFWTFDDNLHLIGARQASGPGKFFGGYLAEFIAVDGTQLVPTDVGEFKNGVFIPKNPSGLTFGTNGFYLKFSNSGALGTDSSGNGHTFATTGLTADHQVLDSPTFGS